MVPLSAVGPLLERLPRFEKTLFPSMVVPLEKLRVRSLVLPSSPPVNVPVVPWKVLLPRRVTGPL